MLNVFLTWLIINILGILVRNFFEFKNATTTVKFKTILKQAIRTQSNIIMWTLPFLSSKINIVFSVVGLRSFSSVKVLAIFRIFFKILKINKKC